MCCGQLTRIVAMLGQPWNAHFSVGEAPHREATSSHPMHFLLFVVTIRQPEPPLQPQPVQNCARASLAQSNRNTVNKTERMTLPPNETVTA
jgi:hypothetical protein